MLRLTLGQIEVHEIVESINPAVDPYFLFPTLARDRLAAEAAWLAPRCYDPVTDTIPLTIRSWLLKTPRHRILIDTCCGNDKPRPYFPPADHLDQPYLQRLRAAGCAPEEIDFVMCTHLHIDHCGWNTRLVDGGWVPTFPNARHLFSRIEYEAWATADDGDRPLVAQRDVFEDSVLPVMAAGLADLVDSGFAPLPGLTIEAAPGHSPGHALIRVADDGTTGLFVGDALHHPIQIAAPEISTAFCTDPDEAERSRRRILADCAEHGHVMIPGHFPAPGFVRLCRSGDSFRCEWDE